MTCVMPRAFAACIVSAIADVVERPAPTASKC
jgi:hypothetical protein